MILILNLGLKSIRAIVFNEKGQKLKSVSRPVNTFLHGEQVEQDPEEWWQKGIEVIREAVQESEIKKSVQYITVTSSSSCLVPVNGAGQSVSSSIMVSDRRAVPQAEQLKKMSEFQSLQEENPNVSAQPSLMIPKIMWMQKHEPELFSQTKYFLSPNDFLIHRMTQIVVTDVLNAEKFYYDSKKKSYPVALLKGLQIPEETLPPVKNIGSEIGPVSTEFKSRISFPANREIKVILTTYDAICAFFGSGVSDEGEACDVSGTISSLRVLTKKRPERINTQIYTQYEPTQDIFIIGGSNNMGGGLIEWVKQCFYRDDKYPYEAMENEAKESLPGGHGIIFLPYLLGERAPLWDTSARGVFFGLERSHTRKELIRAVFESVGYSIFQLMESIESQGIHVKTVRFSGGLARIKLIAQIKADIFGKEVQLVDEFETTSLGAFILAGISIRLFSSLTEATKIVRTREVVIPNADNMELYSKFFELYKEVYQILKPVYLKRQKLVSEAYFEKIERIDNL